MSVRAKFKVEEVAEVAYNKEVRKVKLYAVMDNSTPENQRYAKFTPSGTIEMVIDNPIASDQLKVGKVFYVDFNEADVA